ncbi:Kiwa anti-phage protein KwaB-like domain-containing protein [Halopseudomonas pelagia]|uniref:Kiwa anti-phage protein KwaB-like domain-containing protein n=1 Tax=Halopseudomonas pelagia TaxID=553151 RepID=UPI00039C8568|nr:Kiwa anti-phage protein KwaB-like domain-containing protein [Halopseudomonas pelagia]
MNPEQALSALQYFDIEAANLSLWTFKKSRSRAGRFKAQSVVATPELIAELKNIAATRVGRCAEVENYDLITQINEASCLFLEADETLFPQLQDAVDQPPEECLIDSFSDLQGSLGYVVRLAHGEDVLYCIARLPGDWQVKTRKKRISLVLHENRLDLAGDETLSISKTFDFFVLNENILVVNRANFESLLEYKQTYITSFAELQADAGFQSVFSDITLLIEHVGANTMHLRRMAVVQERAFYNNVPFMEKLRDVSQTRNWNIVFDANGKIVPSPESVRTIIQVLLNHRLHSEMSGDDFDVPSTSPVR